MVRLDGNVAIVGAALHGIARARGGAEPVMEAP
ncbi:hypothetical protein Gocc_1312 [Gaiella occulta]|uniref:Uncharacterized protein n=1 Tax=Gaiella occulta TaxID=1002870 RepID=A0A7M2Z0H6_9ACTN|nr:hypothetical protein Gocc_1312 [Gaiella occulta]